MIRVPVTLGFDHQALVGEAVLDESKGFAVADDERVSYPIGSEWPIIFRTRRAPPQRPRIEDTEAYQRWLTEGY